MVEFLADQPLLLLFAVVALGAAAGSVHVRSISLGPAAALFAGLAVGAIDDSIGATGLTGMRELGLILFTYTVGVASGPMFVAGLRRGGALVIVVTAVLVGVLAVATAGLGELLGLDAAERAGIFAGATTNTPALQAAAEALPAGDPVVGYALTYPTAVVAMIVVLTLLLGRRLPLPATLVPPEPPVTEPLVNWTVEIAHGDLPTLAELRALHGIGFSRLEHEGVVSIARPGDRAVPGDSLVVVGPRPAVAAFCAAAGRRSDRHLPLDRSTLDFRRVVVSNRVLAGAPIAHLRLEERFGAAITRLRRADIDIAATDAMRLQLGDRVRVVGPRDALAEVAAELGDSERQLSEIDAAGLALGIAAGLLIGALSIPAPGGRFELGAGGGTLVAGLVLGARSRLGPVTFQLPHGANLVLRQLGVLVFLAAAGIGSGATFADAVATRRGLELLAVGSVVATGFALLIPLVVEVVLRRDVVATAGMFAGVETQPAALAYAVERTDGDERLGAAYALAFPIAMIAKILAIQLLV